MMRPVSSTIAAYGLIAYLGSVDGLVASSLPCVVPDAHDANSVTGTHAGTGGWTFLLPSAKSSATVNKLDEQPLEVWQESELEKELHSFRTLKDGWDGERALPPKGSGIDQAIAFAKLAGKSVALFEPTVHVDGSIILELGGGGGGSLRFRGDGTIVYATMAAGLGIADFDGLSIPDHIALSLLI